MTLTERVRAIGLAEPQAFQEAEAPLTVAELRRDIKGVASFEAIAQLLTDKPQSAKNELRAACQQALSTPKWGCLGMEDKRILTDQLIDVVFGMGPLETLIEDEGVTEVMVNGAREVYFEREGRIVKSDVAFENDDQVRVLIDRIIGPLGRRIDESSPMVNARLPQGHRVNAVIPPITPDGPHLTIRAFGKRSLTLGEMAQAGSLSTGVACYLSWLIAFRKNVVVSGGTGSGKTTLLNALSCLISPDERVVTIEDSLELKLSPKAHVVRMEARPRNAEGCGEVTIRDLVINALRMRPDRIIVGECRSAEALDMLQAMNTGHDGSLTTLHANTPQDVVDRMVTMVRYGSDLPVDAIEAQIGSAFDEIVHVVRDREGRRFVSEVAEVGFDRKERRCVVETVFLRSRSTDPGEWVRPPKLLDELHGWARSDEALGREVSRWEEAELSRQAA